MGPVVQAFPFIALDLALVVLAWRRPWIGLVVLLAGLPFNGFLTDVVSDLLRLGAPARLALAGWHDGLVAGIALAAAIAFVRDRERRLGLIEGLVLLVLAIGAVYVVVAPFLLTALYAYRTLYEPPILLASLLVLARSQGMPAWVPQRSAMAMVASGVVAALAAWPQVYIGRYMYLQTFYTDPPGSRLHVSFTASGITQPRAIGTFNSPNEFGAYLAIVIGLLLVPGLVKVRLALRLWALAAVALALLLTFSRSSWIGAAIVAVLVAFFARDHLLAGLRGFRGTFRPRAWLSVAAPVVAAAGLAAAVVLTSGAPRYVQRSVTGQDPSAQGRPESVMRGLIVLRNNPLGLGLGTAGPKARRLGEGADRPRIHSEMWYIVYAIQVGVIGLLAFAALVAAIAWKLWSARRLPWSQAAFAAGMALAAGALIIPIVDDPPVATPLWAIAGLALVLAGAAHRVEVPRRITVPVGSPSTS